MFRRAPAGRSGTVNRAQLVTALQRSGLSDLGIREALQGSVVSSPADRAVIARLLTAIANLPPHTVAGIYEYPGAYAQRFND